MSDMLNKQEAEEWFVIIKRVYQMDRKDLALELTKLMKLSVSSKQKVWARNLLAELEAELKE